MAVLYLPSAAIGQNETSYIGFPAQNCVQRSATPVSIVLTDTCQECQECTDRVDFGTYQHSRSCKRRPHRWRDLWDGSLDVGLNGASGSSEDLNLVVGLDAERVMGLNTISLDLDYLFQKEESSVTKNRLYWLGGFEHDIPNTRWSWFADSWFEYDEFEEFKSRIGLHLGVSTLLVDSDCCSLKGRFGLGSSKKSEGPDTGWKPEALLGADYELRLTKRQTLKIKTDFYPDIGNLNDYRLNTRGSWEVLLSEDADIRFAISAFGRYDSTPSLGETANELDYWLSLNFGF